MSVIGRYIIFEVLKNVSLHGTSMVASSDRTSLAVIQGNSAQASNGQCSATCPCDDRCE